MAKKARIWDGSQWIELASGILASTSASTIDWNNVTNKPTEISYLTGVTSSIQNQIDSKLSLDSASAIYLPISSSSNYLFSSTASSIYATLASPTFTGVPLAPTATSGTNTTQIATTQFVRTEVAALVDSAPSTLDTLNELAAALGDDPNFATTVTNSIANKLDAATASTLYLPISGSVNWDNINNKPDPVITLSGDLSGSVTLTDLTNGTLDATIVANSVALGTDTTGNYVAGLTAGNGISITGTEGEAWSPTVSINSATASVTFANVTSKPTTLSGYGITDALPASASSNFAPLTILTNSQTGTSYTLALSDAGKIIEMNNAAANLVVIPLNSTVAFPTGTKIDIIQTGAGATSASIVSGVTLNSEAGKRTVNAQWQAATLVKRATDTWVMIGALKA